MRLALQLEQHQNQLPSVDHNATNDTFSVALQSSHQYLRNVQENDLQQNFLQGLHQADHERETKESFKKQYRLIIAYATLNIVLKGLKRVID